MSDMYPRQQPVQWQPEQAITLREHQQLSQQATQQALKDGLLGTLVVTVVILAVALWRKRKQASWD